MSDFCLLFTISFTVFQHSVTIILKEASIFFLQIKVNALIKRGSLYITKEHQTEGLADFAHAARIDPNNSDIYHHRGHVSNSLLLYTLRQNF